MSPKFIDFATISFWFKQKVQLQEKTSKNDEKRDDDQHTLKARNPVVW